jgi:hypothetical protein
MRYLLVLSTNGPQILSETDWLRLLAGRSPEEVGYTVIDGDFPSQEPPPGYTKAAWETQKEAWKNRKAG